MQGKTGFDAEVLLSFEVGSKSDNLPNHCLLKLLGTFE